MGEWKEVILDNRFLSFDTLKLSANQFWIIVLQKAWAKLCGSYENNRQISITSVIQDLTGASILRQRTRSIKFYDEIIMGVIHKWIILAQAK